MALLVLNERGRALNGLGNYKEALTYLDKALDIAKYKSTFYNKAYALNGLGKYKEAITNLDEALAIDPNFGDALNFKAAILDRNATKFLQYENSTYGIKMQYPSDWRVEGASNSSIIASLLPQGDNASSVVVEIGNLSTNFTPDQYLSKVMRLDVADYKDFPDIRFNQNTTNNIVLAGHPGYLLNGTFRHPTWPPDTIQKFTNIGTIIGDKAYSVIYYSPAYTYPVYLPTFTQMIKSFEVIPQKISSENAAVR